MTATDQLYEFMALQGAQTRSIRGSARSAARLGLQGVPVSPSREGKGGRESRGLSSDHRRGGEPGREGPAAPDAHARDDDAVGEGLPQ